MAEKSKGRKVDDALLMKLGKLDNQFIEIRNQFTNSKSPRSDFEEVKQVLQWLQERRKITLAEEFQMTIGERFTPSKNNPFPIVKADKDCHLPKDFFPPSISDPSIRGCINSLGKYYGSLDMAGFNKKILDVRKKADKLAEKYGIDYQRIIPIAVPSLYIASRKGGFDFQLCVEQGPIVERVAASFLEKNLLEETDLWLQNDCSQKMGMNYFDSIGAYKSFLQGLTDDVNIVLLLVDAFQGYSVQACRWELEHHCPQIIPAGSFIVSHLLAEMPQIMSRGGHLKFDAPGDLYDKNGKRNFSESINFEIMETQDEGWLKFYRKPAEHPDSTHSSVVILNG